MDQFSEDKKSKMQHSDLDIPQGDVLPDTIAGDTISSSDTHVGHSSERRRVVAPKGRELGDRYALRGTIGQGGIGRVLLGFDKQLDREVAIKELLPSTTGSRSAKILSRFLREAKITGQLEHPGVIPVYEIGQRSDGSQYYVMKYVRGKTLEQAIDDCRSDSREDSFRKRMALLDHIIDVCDCMAYAHTKGVIHRDLKPGNIVIGEFGETVILDWGLARHLNREEDPVPVVLTPPEGTLDSVGLTQAGEILGTPAYMAPEQANPATGTIDQTTDVYALGTILFHLLTGRLPYQSTSVKEQFQVLLDASPTPAPRDVEERVPPELSAICEKATAKRQVERFSNAEALAEELRAYRDGRLVSVYAYTRGEIIKRFVQKNKALVAAGCAAVLAIVIGAGLSIRYGVQADRMRDEAVLAHVEATKARARAERSLVEVTDLSKFTLAYSRKASDELQRYFDVVTTDMHRTARQMAAFPLSDVNAMQPLLKELHAEHPETESFMMILPPGTIGPVWPPKYQKIKGMDISSQSHIRWIFRNKKPVFSRVFKAVEGFWAITIQVPVFRDGAMVGTLATVMKTAEVIPAAFSAHLSQGGLWCMQDDGYILYDSDPQQIGKYLFTDSMYDNFPELRSLGRRMLLEGTGIGMYQYKSYAGEGITYKVAAWHTLQPCDGVSWKIIVVQPYSVR